MGRTLLIAAIYAPSPLNATWYELQRRFIARTTTVDHTFQVYLNGVDAAELGACDVLATSSRNEGHSHALGQVLEHFRAQPRETYLILDSDCFPVRRGWHEVLTAQMARLGKQFAAPVRFENLDLFPHPSAFFLLGGAVADSRIDFSTRRAAPNLLGEALADVGTAMQDLGGALLPLLRTNVVNVHPVAAAIYHHLFYHHGAGTREDYAFRVLRRFRYHDHWYAPETTRTHRDEILAALVGDPEGFIGTLLGEREPLIRRYLR